jgi:hypothetical protein
MPTPLDLDKLWVILVHGHGCADLARPDRLPSQQAWLDRAVMSRWLDGEGWLTSQGRALARRSVLETSAPQTGPDGTPKPKLSLTGPSRTWMVASTSSNATPVRPAIRRSLVRS